jgi:hypothetical protein
LSTTKDSVLCQQTIIVVTNPLTLTPLSVTPDALTLRVDNHGEPFDGFISLAQPSLSVSNTPIPVHFAEGETVTCFPLAPRPKNEGFGLLLLDKAKQPVFSSPDVHLVTVDDFAPGAASRYTLQADGDAKVHSEQTLAEAAAPEPLPNRETPPCLRLTYNFSPGWKYIMMHPAARSAAGITGKPASLGLWIYGDGSGNAIRLRFTDAERQTHQVDGGTISFKGWKHIALPLDGSASSSWGGPKDGKVHYPIRWETLFLLDHVTGGTPQGSVYITQPTLFYGQ